MSHPEISIVMPVYNAAAYLEDAVTSILRQTFRDFEFIIINDGSTDTTTAILERYAELDGRIRLYDQENQGMISALNCGCRLARGRYIARMDADDISLPRRFEKQLAYLERHPRIGILGTWIYNMDENGGVTGTWSPPTNPEMLKWTNFFGVCVSHSTVLMRREVIEKLNFYRPDAVNAEDVDLWLRACAITEFGNIPEPLGKYRVWTGGTHHRSLKIRRDAHVRLLASYIEDFLNFVPPLETVAGLRQTRVGLQPESSKQIRSTGALVQQLYRAFVKKNDLTLAARREISFDAAKKLALLGLEALRFDTRSSASLLLQALQLDYRLLHPSIMMKGLRRMY